MVKNLSVKDNRCIMYFLRHLVLIRFNYDLPMIVAALRGDTNQQLKQLSDAIINSEQVWQYCDNSN